MPEIKYGQQEIGERLEIRATDVFGKVDVKLNGQPLRFWQSLELRFAKDEFNTATLTIAVGSVDIDERAAIELIALAKSGETEGQEL